MQLLEVTRHLAELSIDDTIFARVPWSPDSEALIAPLTGDHRVPPSITERGFSYFLEVAVSLEVMEGWHASQPTDSSLLAACERLIYYATHDA